MSVSPESGKSVLVREALRVWFLRKAGEEARGGVKLWDERRDWKRLSKGRKEGVGLSRPRLETTEGRILLPPGEESTEPYEYNQ